MFCTCLPAYLASPQPRPCPLCVFFKSSLKGHGRTSLKSSKVCVCLPHTCFETTLIRSSRQLSSVHLPMWHRCICLANQMQCLLIAPQERADHIFYCTPPYEKSHCCRRYLHPEKSPGYKKKLASSLSKFVMFSLWLPVLQIFWLLYISLASSAGCSAVMQPHP